MRFEKDSLFKKIISFVLAGVMVGSSAGCGNSKYGDSSDVVTEEICYVAQSGDTLSDISHTTGVFIEDIKAQNPILFERGLWVGDKLVIAVPSDKVDEIINSQNSDGLSGTFYVVNNDENIIIKDKIYFEVGEGDSLSQISDATEVLIDDIIAENPVLDERGLWVGDTLTISVDSKKVDAIINSQDIDGLNGRFYKNSVDEVEYAVIYFKAGKGDSLTRISEATGVSIADIKAQNFVLYDRKLWVGDKLVITVSADRVDTIINSQDNDGLAGSFSISGDFELTSSIVKTSVYYKVGKGDNLIKIAKLFGISVDEIAKLNNISNTDVIHTDDILEIQLSDVNCNYNELTSKYKLNGKVFGSKAEAIAYNAQSQDSAISDDVLFNFPSFCERGIDFGYHVGKVDWDKLEAAYKRGEFSYIILRIASDYNAQTKRDGFTVDFEFERNLEECNKRGIPYGGYVFYYASSIKEVEEHSRRSVEYLKSLDNFKPSYPVYADFLEGKKQMDLCRNGDYDILVDMMYICCKTYEDNGIFPGLYVNRNDYYTVINGATNASKLDGYSGWYAYYGKKESCDQVCKIGDNGGVDFTKVDSIQVSSKGKVDGIKAMVDVNITRKSLRDEVRQFYIDTYGDNYYSDVYEEESTASYEYDYSIDFELDEETFNVLMSNSNIMDTLLNNGMVYVEKTGKFVYFDSSMGKSIIKTKLSPVPFPVISYGKGYCRSLKLN